ncbi:MAG TPA: GNAT family N-acetyltransferase [Spirochaetia bacterium]|nr:GNAT family N-acetyltransferase [Spirochaetia bacterium]
MLDYTLVTPKATYRPITPTDVPGFLQLAAGRFREEAPELEIGADQILLTVRELQRHKEKGSILVFEREACLVGYCILVPCWSNAHGGMLLVIDELYVAPAQREQGIAEDFITLLKKAAPRECVGLRLDVPRAGRKAMSTWRKLGFDESEGTTLTLRVDRS